MMPRAVVLRLPQRRGGMLTLGAGILLLVAALSVIGPLRHSAHPHAVAADRSDGVMDALSCDGDIACSEVLLAGMGGPDAWRGVARRMAPEISPMILSGRTPPVDVPPPRAGALTGT